VEELLNNVSDVRQLEVHMAEPLVPGPSLLKVEIAIAKLKKYKSPGSEIPAELIHVGGEILLSAIHKLINSVWNKENCLSVEGIYYCTNSEKKGDTTYCNNYRGISLLSTSYNILLNLLSRLSP
jgi:hypothetical protein